MKKTILILLMLAISIMSSAQRIQRTTGDTLVIDSNNKLVTTPLRENDYGVWRKISLYEDRVHWQTVTQTPWHVVAFGESVKVGKKYQYRICVTVIDSNGITIPDADVRFVDTKKYGKKPLKYDANEIAYISTVKVKGQNPVSMYVTVNNIRREISLNPENDYYFDYSDIYFAKEGKHTLNQNSSWLVTDKNMYKPGDTIRWKAVCVNPNKGSIMAGDSVSISLSLRYDKETSLFRGRLNNRGVAFGEALVDTLKLTADRYYSMTCTYYPENKEASDLAFTTIYYKDYELKDVVVSCRSDKRLYLWNDSVRLSFKVTDEKGDYLDNGVVKCQLFISNINRIYGESVWYQSALTDMLSANVNQGVAVIVVPTSDWLKADYSAICRWSFRSADGTERNGSLFINYRKEPVKEPLVESDMMLDITSFNTINTADSVGFTAVAPFDSVMSKSRPFHWTIYRNARLFAAGVDTVLDWRCAESGEAMYYCFIDGDGINRDSRNIRHGKYGLDVEVVQRKSVIPGSVDEITVRVTDNKGKPVSGVDITALGYTKKLGRNLMMPETWEWYKDKCLRRVANIYGSNTINSGDSVIKEPWLVELLQADSTQYWQLTHNNTDSVRVIKSRSSIDKPQIVPVLVHDNQILPISRLDIDYQPAWITGTNDRYSFAIRNSVYHCFSFYIGDSVYEKTIGGIYLKDNEKVWLSIPLSSCKKSKAFNDKNLANINLKSRRVPVNCHVSKGIGYLVSAGYTGDSIIRPVPADNGVLSRACNHNEVGYYEMRLDGSTAYFPFSLDFDAVSYYSDSRVLIGHDKCKENDQKKLTKKQLKNIVVEAGFPSLDDSICTTAQLHSDWVKSVDSHRASADVNNCFMHSILRIRLLYADKEEKPVNIIYRAEGDSVEYIVGVKNKYYLSVIPGKRYELKFLYKDARVRTLSVDVHESGYHVVKATLDSSMTVIHNDQTVALEDYIRHVYENKMASGGKYTRSSRDYSEDAVELNEVMVVAYGTSSRKSKPMMMKSAAPEANSVRIRGMASNSADAEMIVLEEETEELYALALEAAPVPESEEITIRDDFSDVAFWQPDLMTDKNGEVHFTVKYPDDLTEWRESFVAIKGRQRGYAMSSVIARKDEVAKLKMPRFAVVGDSVSAIGTGVNYITGASAVDTIYAVAEGDSLCMQYVFGHDGEKRCSPVFAQGMEARDANFYIIEGDTSFTLKYNKTISSPMEVNVYTDIREALINSVKELAKSDWCSSNDYLALRLSAMRMVADTDYTKEIANIEKKLLDNRMANGLWSWYGKGNEHFSSLWVTEQVLAALGSKAVADNNFNTRIASDFIRYRNERYWLGMFQVAKLFDIAGDTIQRNLRLDEIPADSLAKYDRSALIEYQMMRGMEVKFDTMRHRTYTGGEYYSLNLKHRCCWFNPVYEQIETSLMAYKYYSQRGDVARCRAIKLWLMQYVRNRGRFGISLGESLSLKIVKTLWQDDKVGVRDLLYQLSIDNKIASELPYSTVVTDDAKLEYKGKRTLYVSTEQKYWEEDPEVVSNGMTIKAEYVSVNEKENRSVIKVDVTLEADAEYLVISIPIPAGCSYDETTYSYTRGESHREEYKDRVNIFCERIGEGSHHFEVPLNERYPGVYTINPSEVHLIYFPAFNANNKKTKVRL